MAELGTKVNSSITRGDTDADTQAEIHQDENPQGLKRGSSRDPSPVPLQKSLRTSSPPPSSTTQLEAAVAHMEPSGEEIQGKNQQGSGDTADHPSLSPSSRRKSWRRSARGRRSLPAHPNPSRILCRNISPSLPEEERLEKLMEASMRLAVEKTQDSLRTSTNACLESFQTQMESMQNKWCSLAKDICNEPQCQQLPNTTPSDLARQRAMEQTRKAIQTLQVESESWESLLKKHRGKADELARRVERGQESGVTLDPACLSQSSQSQLIQSKPDYNSILRRQQPLLHTIELAMDSQCKMVRELRSIQEQSQLLVKETSGRLASEAGFQDLSADPVRNLLARPVSTVLSAVRDPSRSPCCCPPEGDTTLY